MATTTKISKKQTSSLNTTPQNSPPQQRAIDTMFLKEKEKEKEKTETQNSLQLIQETLIKMQESMQKTQESIDCNRVEARKQHEDLKTELRAEMGEVKEKVGGIDVKIAKIQKIIHESDQKIKNIEERVQKSEDRIDNIEDRNDTDTKNLIDAITQLEMEKASHNLRFQNIIEEKDEDLGLKMTEILAKILQINTQEMVREIDEVYRVQTNFARRHNLPREVHIKFARRTVRDTIYRWSREQTLEYKEKEIIILKQIPKRVRENRREYYFLTRKLIKDNIMFRWLVPDGLMVTWQGKKIKLENLEQAKDFYDESGLIGEEQGSKDSRGSKDELEGVSQEEEERIEDRQIKQQKKQLQKEVQQESILNSRPRYETRYTKRCHR